MSERRYWIGVVAQDHAEAAVAHGFVQLTFGRAAPLERMQPGDGLAYYSPRATYPDGVPLQAFTAIGRVVEGPVFAAEAVDPAPTFRRSAAYFDATPVPIKPLLERLSFIRNKEHWGAAFRFGVLRVPRDDFAAIAAAMGRDPDIDFA
ncbi:MAG: EVE domain-containing protein [Burkholderiales bacterium]